MAFALSASYELNIATQANKRSRALQKADMRLSLGSTVLGLYDSFECCWTSTRDKSQLGIIRLFWIGSAIVLVSSYLLGSIPTGYLVGKIVGNIDIREYGSSSTGATNVLRTLDKGPALVVLVVDVLKGAIAIFVALWVCSWLAETYHIGTEEHIDILTTGPWLICIAGVAVLLGHGRSIWLNFTGGKSAATGLGVLLAISLPLGIGIAAIWGLTLAAFRIVSLSSIFAALAAVVLIIVVDNPLPYRLLVIVGALYVLARHRENIKRLFKGTEPRLGQLKR